MSKIEIKNIYKIFGNHPDQILPIVKEGANKEQCHGRNWSHCWTRQCLNISQRR